MNRYNISLKDLKYINDLTNKGFHDEVIEYFNTFKGDNIVDKFKNILKVWDYDVSPTLDFNINGKNTKIQVSFLLSQFEDSYDDITLNVRDSVVKIGLPSNFNNSEGFPIYECLKYIKISDIEIDLSNLEEYDKKVIIDNLPPYFYSEILIGLVNHSGFVYELQHEALSDFKINLLSSDLVVFLKNLFANYDYSYFQDIIYYLSKRIDGSVLMESSPSDIQVYLDKFAAESKEDSLHLR